MPNKEPLSLAYIEKNRALYQREMNKWRKASLSDIAKQVVSYLGIVDLFIDTNEPILEQMAVSIADFLPKRPIGETGMPSAPKKVSATTELNIGQQALKYLDKALPQEKIFSPTLTYLAMQRACFLQQLCTDDALPEWFFPALEGIRKADSALNKIRGQNLVACMSDIKKIGCANCAEYASVMATWLIKHGVSAVPATLYFTDLAYKEVFGGHAVVFYSLDNKPFEACITDLKNPNVQIVDLWLRQAGTAEEMLTAYTNIFGENNVLSYYKNFENNRRILIKPKKFLDDRLTRYRDTDTTFDVGKIIKSAGKIGVEFEKVHQIASLFNAQKKQVVVQRNIDLSSSGSLMALCQKGRK